MRRPTVVEPVKPTLSTSRASSASDSPSKVVGPSACTRCKHVARDAALPEERGEGRGDGWRRLGWFPDDGVAAQQSRHEIPGRHRDGEVRGRHDRRHADRCAEREQLLVRHLAGHRLAVEPAALAEEEVAGVDDLLHLAERLGIGLAHLPGHESGERLLVGLDEPPDLRDDATAHRRRNGSPVQLRRARQPAGVDESVAVRGVDLGDDVVEVSGVAGDDAGGRGGHGATRIRPRRSAWSRCDQDWRYQVGRVRTSGDQLVGRQGPAHQVALGPVAAHRAQRRELLGRLDSLGDDEQLERVREVDHGRDHGVVAAVAEPAHERPVDLEERQVEALQVGQRRVAGAEVVEADLDAELGDAAQRLDDDRARREQGSFGDLHADRRTLDAVPRHRRAHAVDERGVLQRARRHVGRDGCAASRSGSADHAANCRMTQLEHPRVELDDQAGLLGDVDELGRGDHVAVGQHDAGEALDRADAPRAPCR